MRGGSKRKTEGQRVKMPFQFKIFKLWPQTLTTVVVSSFNILKSHSITASTVLKAMLS